jgi:polyisoprenoid-binding protein YceI
MSQSSTLPLAAVRRAGRRASATGIRLTACLVMIGGLVSGPARAEMARYVIDPEHFSILFAASHIGYKQQLGMCLEGSGSFGFDETTNEVADLVVEIDARSVFTNHQARDNHLRSGDFLDAEAHPMIRFVMTEAEPLSDSHGIITGDLTWRGVTLPVTLDVRLNKIGAYPWGSNYVVGVSAETVIERSDFGSTYALEGGLVGDEVALTFEIEAIRQD